MDVTPADEDAVRALYRALMRRWNAQDANGFAALFNEDGSIIIFDGTLVAGQPEIARHFGVIFSTYSPPAYVLKIRSVRFLNEEVALACGIVGMYTLAEQMINPTLNAIQSLVAHRRDGVWRVAFFQNTLAQPRGRPDLVRQMTEELLQQLTEE